jgi:hypothetical protein
MNEMILEARIRRLVNTDPQRRCYNGCHAKSEMQWGEWECLQWDVKPDKVEHRLKFWRELNEYSVSVGGTASEYRVVEGKRNG